MNTNVIQKSKELINQEAIMSTFGLMSEDGYPFVSVVYVFKSIALKEFWILTGLNSKKVACIRNNKNTGLCYYSENTNVSLSGVAEIIVDEKLKKELWENWMLQHFDGPTHELCCFIKFTVKKARLFMNGETIELSENELNEDAI